MTGKELVYFTGKCLSLDERPELRDTIISHFLEKKIDYNRFVKLCSDHLVLPLIFLNFRKHHILEILPGDLADHLTTIYELNYERNTRILEELKTINSAFNQQKIFPVFLKGTGNLLDGIYKDLGERIIGDIDLLVPDKDYLGSADILKKMGYTQEYFIYPDWDVSQMQHYPRLFKESAEADVEVHRLPVMHKYLALLNSGMIEKEKQSPVDYPAFQVPSDKHKVILNFIHSRLANRGHALATVSLRDIHDLHCLSRRISIAEVFEDFKKKKKAIAYAVLAQRILGIPFKFYPKESFFSRYTCFRYHLNFRFPVLYRISHPVSDVFSRFLVSYPSQLIRSVYRRDLRKSLITRITSPKYWAGVLDSYRYLWRK